MPRASLWLHGVAALGIVAEPQHWPQMLAVLAGNHAVLGALMHPRSTQLGPIWSPCPAPWARPSP
ncbi:hypothetical protein ACFQY5_04000 [Paeniroseomonas aquatica]|uniref:hypothetical protein n=1 Tax=Paeniroseomonas aquatica TaxID=373043 RepID=UPI0036105C53